VTESHRALSAYTPTHASAAATIDFALPLQIYIIETIERDAYTRRLRQVGMIATLVVGMFVSQWPVAFSTANAVPTVPISAKEAGARTSPVAMERLAFAPGLIR
jgi:hypothetical protein